MGEHMEFGYQRICTFEYCLFAILIVTFPVYIRICIDFKTPWNTPLCQNSNVCIMCVMLKGLFAKIDNLKPSFKNIKQS